MSCVPGLSRRDAAVENIPSCREGSTVVRSPQAHPREMRSSGREMGLVEEPGKVGKRQRYHSLEANRASGCPPSKGHLSTSPLSH